MPDASLTSNDVAFRKSRLSARDSSGKRTHVAAVCYRWQGEEPEFLLVRTRSGRWTFPKGGVDGDPSQAHAAAREAYEEAGVSGKVERKPFHWYFHCKQRFRTRRALMPVYAHLCEVVSVEPPQEEHRDPTWFSPTKARQRLSQNRAPELAAEVVAVVDRALLRLQKRSACAA